jgi:hypothetical protein
MLSKELRLRIWEYSIEQYRLLEVKVEPPSDSRDTLLYSTTNALNNLVSGRNYTAIIQGCQVYSKLLRISSESREVALRFYRVHIPCYLQTSKRNIVKATFYFNPEYDFIHLRGEHLPVEQSFIDFLHDFKAYDPKNIGLINLALGSNDMTMLHFHLKKISSAPARMTFVDVLSRLQQLIWIAHSHAGRAIMGPLQGFQGFNELHGVGVRFNHSLPVKAITPSFNLLRQDPRPVGPELRYVLTAASDPRRMRVQWRELLKRWGVYQAQPAKERVLFAYEPLPHEEQVCDFKTADKYLREEEEKWLGAQERWHWVTMKHAGKVPVEGPEELAKATRPAIGFWLFPAEALGSLEDDLEGMKKVFDMTGHWPELALSYLS